MRTFVLSPSQRPLLMPKWRAVDFPPETGHRAQTPGAVVDIIDGTMRQLHQIRERAIGESRRRLDAAMERSATLLDEIRTRRGPVR